MIGQTISHYRILAKLGEGGMGAVYRAEDLTLGRDTALKFLPADMAADPQARRRLLKEAQAASRLNHPNIATIYEVNVTETTPFISMELVEGETLKQMLLRAPLTPAQFVSAGRQIAEGLHDAHRSGVHHRDIKPGNIMLDSRSRVKILDFGLAELARHERAAGETEETFATRTTTQNTTGGTVPYMSPEQLRGEPVDARSDIFSFGVLLYESLTGRLPFQGETSIDILYAILRSPYTPLRTLVPEIDTEWETLIDRCLAKSPGQRWASMEEILKSFEQWSAPGHIATPLQRPDKSIAVLYFANLSTNKEDEYFRDGMTEDIITELTKIKQLQLLPRSAVLAFRDKPQSVVQIGQQLAVAYVLDGSLRRAGNRLRITAQLAETRTGHSVWAERYDRQLEDVFAIQDEIAQNIARALRVMLSDREVREIEKVPTRDVQAYDYCLRARQVFYEFRRKSLEYARQMFQRALQIDPAYARAHAGVADCCCFLYMYWDASESNLQEAESASLKALELSPDLAEAHVARGLALSRSKHYDEARKEFDQAIQLNPKLFEAYYIYARVCFAQGDLQEAARLYEQAARIRPEDYQVPVLLASVYTALSRDDAAGAARLRGLDLAEKHLQLNPDDARAYYLGAGAMLKTGERQRCIEWSNKALAMDPEEPLTLYNVACNYSLLGRIEESIECLERAVKFGYRHKQWLEHDSDLDPLRGHARFQELLKSLGNH